MNNNLYHLASLERQILKRQDTILFKNCFYTVRDHMLLQYTELYKRLFLQ